jgi:Uma2 family endonuclease
MIAPTHRTATYADVEALPDGMVGELIGGALYAHARPAAPHASVHSRLGFLLGPAFDRGVGGPGGWLILHEPELRFDADVLVPDLAGWRRERMPRRPDVPYFTLAPDWICEVLSPATRRVDRMLKLPVYARVGVRHAWLVDPIDRSIEVFRLGEAGWIVTRGAGEGEPVGLEPFDALPLDLTYLWGD